MEGAIELYQTTPPRVGSIDIEKTCAQAPPRKSYDIILEAQDSTTPHIIILIDVSTSITPEQRNLAYVLAIALYQNPIDLSICLFSTTSTTILNPHESLSLQELFMRLHHTITPGYTHLHKGMQELERCYTHSSQSKTLAIVLSDGISNYGQQVHHKDFFLPHFRMLCFQKQEKIHTIHGFSPSVIQSLEEGDALSVAFRSIDNYIIEYSQ